MKDRSFHRGLGSKGMLIHVAQRDMYWELLDGTAMRGFLVREVTQGP